MDTSTELIESSNMQSFVTLQLAQQTYALPIAPIVQVIPMVAITPIPQSEAFPLNTAIEGLINVRGTAVPVLNLRHYMGQPKARLQLHTPIVLVQANGHMMGLIVDRVSDVINFPEDRIMHPQDVLPEEFGSLPFLRGLLHMPDGIVLLLDLEHLTSLDQAQKLAQAVETELATTVEQRN